MANIEIVDVITLPVFTSFPERESDVGLTFANMPYTTVRVPIFEVSGLATADDWLQFPIEGDLLYILAAVYNRAKTLTYLAIFDNYTTWNSSIMTPGLAVEFSGVNDHYGDYVPHLKWIQSRASQGSHWTGSSEHGFICRSKNDGSYKYLYFTPDPTGGDGGVAFVIGINDSIGVPNLVDFTGPTEVPPVEDEDVEVYEPGGISKPDGGGGTFGRGEESENIEDLLPNGSAESDSSNSGLFTRYAMTSSMLRTLGAALYTDDLLAKIGKEIMSFLYNSPAEALISLISYPFSISSIMGTTSTNIKFGSLEIPVSGNRLNSTFAQIDWGTVTLEPYWGNFLDYSPHTKIDLYLPWCTGSVQLDPHECYPGKISIKTNIEISKGTCIHSVFGNQGALIGTYSGVVGSQLPITALDSSGKMLSFVTAAASLGVSALAGGGAKSAEIRGANQAPPISMLGNRDAQVAWRNEQAALAAAPYNKIQRTARGVALASSIAAFRTPQHVVRNNSFSGNGAGLGMQFPFIIISRPEQSIPENYGKYFGYPSNVYVSSLQTVGGYTEIGSIHLDGIPCTENEREEIAELLKGGVIL